MENKTKDRLFTGSLILAVIAIIVILLCQWCGNKRDTLEKEKQTLIQIHKKDSLDKVIRNLQDQLSALQSEKGNLIQSLQKDSAENKKLLNDKTNLNKQLKNSGIANSQQKEKINSLLTRNDSLLAGLSSLQGKIDELTRNITKCEKETGVLNTNLTDLNNKLKEKDALITNISDSLITEHKADSVKMLPVFVSIGELSGGPGLRIIDVPYSRYYVGGSMLFGLEFNKRFLTGIGTGIHIFNGGSMVPLFLEFRYGLPLKKWTPFIFSQGGALFNISDVHLTSVFYVVGAGLRHPFNDNLALSLGAGIYTHSSGISSHDSFLNFKVGLIFSKYKSFVK